MKHELVPLLVPFAMNYEVGRGFPDMTGYFRNYWGKGNLFIFSFVINSAFDMVLFVLLLDCQFGMSPPRFLGWDLGSDCLLLPF